MSSENHNNTFVKMQIATTDSPSSWTWFENKVFEQLLLMFPEGSPERWEKISEKIPGKTPSMVREHYDALLHDVRQIDSGLIDLPAYVDDSPSSDTESSASNQISFGPEHNRNDSERKKNTRWTVYEHGRFLLGLEFYGKGDWENISRNYVITRTPSQVASYAQKYLSLQNSVPEERKGPSIHDITTADNTAIVPPNDFSHHQGGSL